MHDRIKLTTPIDVSSADVEKALFEQAKDEAAVARAVDHLRGSNAQRAADELNQALVFNVFELLLRGWGAVRAVRDAVQRSVLTPGPPAIVRFDQHNITSTSTPVLNIHVAQRSLPELRLTLELIASVQSATLAARDGQIELVALGEASVTARLKYKGVLLKEHVSGVEGAPRDPFRRQRAAPDQRAGVVDFHI